MRATDLPEDLYGAALEGVRELLFAPSGESALPMREAVALDLGGRTLIIHALTDTSELSVAFGALKAESADYRLRNASSDSHFAPFIGQLVRNWWVAENDRGYTDAFLVGFGASRGLLFVAINNVVSVLTTSGELLA
jgi:hypothetical protein